MAGLDLDGDFSMDRCDSNYGALGPMLSSTNVNPPFELSADELRKSDIKILTSSFNKLTDKAIGMNGILLRSNGERWIVDYIYEDGDSKFTSSQ